MRGSFPVMLVLVTATLLAATAPAGASGGLSCSADDNGVTVELGGGVGRGMGGPLFSFSGDVAIADTSVAGDLRSMKFEREHVPQYWLDGKELRLGLYRERDIDKAHGYVQLDVLAAVRGEPDEGVYEGTFVVSVWDGAGDGDPREYKAEGAIECFVE